VGAVVSVVVPMYNASPWIGDAIESVHRQSLPTDRIELVVVDDASRDDSVQVARSAIERHALRGRIIQHAQNSGVSAARNTGWHHASADWIQFLDADDLLAPHKLALQVEYVERASQRPDVVCSAWQELHLDEDGWQPSGPVLAPVVDEYPVLQILQATSLGYVGPTLITRQALASVAGFDEQLRIGEDLDLMLRIAMRGGRFRCVASATPSFYRRQTPGSLWQAGVVQLEQMRRLLLKLRHVEAYLRASGPIDAAAADALAAVYNKCASFVNDPDTLLDVARWISELGSTYSPELGRTMRFVSRWIGWENAVRVRALYRRAF
jgi:glycosyltransferase involved in cell wall biosynthesis